MTSGLASKPEKSRVLLLAPQASPRTDALVTPDYSARQVGDVERRKRRLQGRRGATDRSTPAIDHSSDGTERRCLSVWHSFHRVGSSV
jgi:hypothetical protein